MLTPRSGLAVALVACAALSACANQGAGDGTPAPSPSPSASATDSPTPTAPATPTTAVPAPSSSGKPSAGPSRPPGPGATTLTGTVEAGVEPGCRMLSGYQLIGGPDDVLTAGARVVVTGHAKADMMTTCQQGTPFVVESARRD
ncbi:hypothetical protein [Micromonospora sp. DT233]|uniref:hypothetical protein n=1 Tax=Micromonospora sp. DT233 TaxID=3393432 RepID=UPI003CED9723